jgi:hypothetical protein
MSTVIKFSESTVKGPDYGIIPALDEYIVGMDVMKEAFSTILSKPKFPLFSTNNCPLWVILVGGPTGTGKTQICKALGEILLGVPDAITLIKGETFSEWHSVAWLTGSPPWYIWDGYVSPLADIRLFDPYERAKKEGKLHTAVQWRSGFAILVIDEIEKAHPNLYQLLLSPLSGNDFTLTSGRDITTDARSGIRHNSVTPFGNVIVVLTTNLWEKELSIEKASQMGFMQHTQISDKEANTRFNKTLLRHFSPEFLGRMQYTLRGADMTAEGALSIAKLLIKKWSKKVTTTLENKVIITSDAPSIARALVWNYDPSKGVRDLEQQFERRFANVFEQWIPSNFEEHATASGYKIHAGVSPEGKISFTLSALASNSARAITQSTRAIKEPAPLQKLPEILSLIGMYCNILDLEKYDSEFSVELHWDRKSLASRLREMGVSKADMRRIDGKVLGKYTRWLQWFLEGDEELDIGILQDFKIEERILESMIRKAIKERLKNGTNVIDSVLTYLSIIGLDTLTHGQLQKVWFLIQRFVSENSKLLNRE